MEDNITIVKVNHPLFGEIDSISTDDGKVWYKGKEVALALGYKSYSAVIKNLKDSMKVFVEYQTPLGYTAHRPVLFLGKNAIKALIQKRTAHDIASRIKESVRQIELI